MKLYVCSILCPRGKSAFGARPSTGTETFECHGKLIGFIDLELEVTSDKRHVSRSGATNDDEGVNIRPLPLLKNIDRGSSAVIHII